MLNLIKIENHLGTIDVSMDYITALIGNTVTNCFGVAQMNSVGPKQGVLSFLDKNSAFDKGVIIKNNKGSLLIDLHITVSYGVNISAITDSIINKVRYAIEEATDYSVMKVNVFIDGMKS